MREGAGSQVVLGQGLSVSLRFLWLHCWGLLPPAFTALLPLHWQCEILSAASRRQPLLPQPWLCCPCACPRLCYCHLHAQLSPTFLCSSRAPLLAPPLPSLHHCCPVLAADIPVLISAPLLFPHPPLHPGCPHACPSIPAHPLLCYWLMRPPATAINKGTLTLSVVWGQGRSGPCRTG